MNRPVVVYDPANQEEIILSVKLVHSKLVWKHRGSSLVHAWERRAAIDDAVATLMEHGHDFGMPLAVLEALDRWCERHGTG